MPYHYVQTNTTFSSVHTWLLFSFGKMQTNLWNICNIFKISFFFVVKMLCFVFYVCMMLSYFDRSNFWMMFSQNKSRKRLILFFQNGLFGVNLCFKWFFMTIYSLLKYWDKKKYNPNHKSYTWHPHFLYYWIVPIIFICV